MNKRSNKRLFPNTLTTVTAADYNQFLNEIKEKIASSRFNAYRGLNRRLIKLYWEIGRDIVDRQEKYGWGKSIVEKLSKDLKREFPLAKGYSSQNLWYMRQLYLEYKDYPNLQQLVGEIPWGQNLVILSRLKTPSEKEFYLRGSQQCGWSRDVLIHQIEAEAHKQAEISKAHNFSKALPSHLAEQADLAMKDTYALDFLDVAAPILEREMERKILGQLKNFIAELGLGFCFIGSQYPLRLRDKDYYIDLLFFHRGLRCLVAFDLKIGEFRAEYAGKMNLYLNLLDDLVRLPEENPSIGIILCKDRDHIEVEYALKGIKKPIGVASYMLSKKLPKKLAKALPSPERLKKGLKDLADS
ncbi:MAG: PDDEXK nuclease domain-containing protein [Candidatus Margulisiibacteriota bacterium]